MLTAVADQEVEELWARWEASHDTETRNRLVCTYLPLVRRVARRIEANLPFPYREELFGFGVIGLLDAIEKFDRSLGYRFETYSFPRITGAMKDGLRKFDWLPRRAASRPNRAIHKIYCVDLQARSATGASLQDSIADPNWSVPLEQLDIQSDHQEVAEAVESELDERERKVIFAHYYERRTLADIGRELGVTESRVSQLHRQALRSIERNLAQRLSA
jgi:RNA polymerase sigma factor for flagellar operon FliA